MFSLDRWQEVLSTLARAPLRSILTSLAVAWGIFMLVMLLGFSHGQFLAGPYAHALASRGT